MYIKTKLFCFTVLSVVASVSIASEKSARPDPTKPPSVIVQQLAPVVNNRAGLQLSAIFKRQSNLYAVINGEIFGLGEKLNGMKIEEISITSVILTESDNSDKKLVLSVDSETQMEKKVVK